MFYSDILIKTIIIDSNQVLNNLKNHHAITT